MNTTQPSRDHGDNCRAASSFRIIALSVVAIAGIVIAGSGERVHAQDVIDKDVKTTQNHSHPDFQLEADFLDWDLEPAIAGAHLIMVARVSQVGKVTVVQGAKNNLMLQEFHFQPVKVLKGLYSRDELTMTAGDLNCRIGRTATSNPLSEGEYRLLILSYRAGNGTWGCAAGPVAQSFEKSVPKLSGVEDPLVGVAEAIIAAVNSRSRQQRVAILSDQLEKTKGLAVIPLLNSLNRRAHRILEESKCVDQLIQLLASPSTTVRLAARQTVQLAMQRGFGPGTTEAGKRLIAPFEKSPEETLPTWATIAEIGSLAELRPLAKELGWPQKRMIERLEKADTIAVRWAALKGLQGLGATDAFGSIEKLLIDLPLDESDERELELFRVASSLDPDGTSQRLLERIQKALAAGQSFGAEARTIADNNFEPAISQLIATLEHPLVSSSDKISVIYALGRLRAEQSVAHLAKFIEDPATSRYAVSALIAIGSQQAIDELRLWLKWEQSTQVKLSIAQALARKKIRDGYSLAIEHLVEPESMIVASETLKLIGDERTQRQLKEILTQQPNSDWSLAALAGLIASGDEEAAGLFAAILEDDRHPQIQQAITAAQLAHGDRIVNALAILGTSRNENLATTALNELQRRSLHTDSKTQANHDNHDFLAERTVSLNPSGENEKEEQISADSLDRLDAVLRDSFAPIRIRMLALQVLSQSSYPNLPETVKALVDQTEFEESPLTRQLELEYRSRAH